MHFAPYQLRKLTKAKLPYLWERLRILNHRSENAVLRDFVANAPSSLRSEYRDLVRQMIRVHAYVQPAHLHSELMQVAKFILEDASKLEGVVVEAGCFKGGSAAKLSQVCAARRRRLILFDSFEGIPPNDEPFQHTIDGGTALFRTGDYAGSLEEVKSTISKYGHIEVCEFRKGWFEETMPSFRRPIVTAFVDVDLVSSIKTCIKYLYPLLVKGGAIFSHDGHLPLVIEALNDERFWQNDLGIVKPRMSGIGTEKLVTIFRD